MKTNKTNKPSPATFTRAEFELLMSLVEDERGTPLAKLNARYDLTLSGLVDRLRSVAIPNDEHAPTDSVTVR